MLRIAVISVHGCPYIQAGEKDAGGMNIYVLETAKQLASRGACVDVYTRRHDVRDPQVVELAPGARVIHLDAGPVEAQKEEVYPLLPQFEQALHDFATANHLRYNLVTSHYWLSGLVGMDLQRQWEVPHVTSFHTLAEVKRRARPGERETPARAESEQAIARSADMVVVWSPHEKDAVTRYYGAPAGRVRIIPPGVDTTRFSPMDQREARLKLGLDAAPTLLYVGRLERLKGLDILLRAMAAIEHPRELRLLVVGGGSNSPELARLQRVASSLEIAERVKFLGSVPQEKLPLYYSAADVSVLPSYAESFGLAALEASACGRPVVASKVGGLPAVVRDGITGYLIAWRCPGPFVERLELLLSNARLRRQMGGAARHHAETMTWSAAAEGLLGAYASLLCGCSGPGVAPVIAVD